MPAVGQIWEYRRHPDHKWGVPDSKLGKRDAVYYTKMAWEIVGGEFHGQELLWIAKVVRDEDGWLDTKSHKFKEIVFETGERFRLIYDPAQDNGVYCGKCGDFFPYANWHAQFKCWACRNGF